MATAYVQNLRQVIHTARQQHRASAGSVLDVLLQTEGIAAESLLDRLPLEAGVAVILDTHGLQPDYSSWDRDAARKHDCVLVHSAEGQAYVAAADPWNEAVLQLVFRRIGAIATPAAVTQESMRHWLGDVEPKLAAELAGPADAIAQATGPIVAFVDTAVRAGFDLGASDIHFECDRASVTAKHRLDGVMKQFAKMEGALQAQEVISRIKVLAQLDITERRLPQDGRFRWTKGGESVDLRVSIMPSVFGEDAVLRLLDKAQLRAREETISLGALGFAAENALLIRDLALEPNGMLLVTGPTGSGKTTTVYAVLSEIQTGLEKIITIEDPVEYELPGVLQIPVNERKGLTFAKGLRSILRHDPDRILVGEIRDAETAEIAVQSALTGHLVFTTVHANSMADIVGRFRHFGLDMFGFMSSLNGVVVQRLMRRLCAACVSQQVPTTRDQEWLERMGQASVGFVPKAVGCSDCRGTGYRGRFVIAEVHVIDDQLRDDVTQGAPVSALKRHAERCGTQTLGSQALQRVLEARTSIEEVRRVVGSL